MGWQRIFHHMTTTPWQLRRAFSRPVRRAIEQAVITSEQHHRGEVRFVV